MEKSQVSPVTMQKGRIVYKALRIEDGYLYSVMHHYIRVSPLRMYKQYRFLNLRYYKSRINVPKVGKLYTFDTLQSAKAFVNEYCNEEHIQIWECEAWDVEETKYIIRDGGDWYAFVKEFWKHYTNPDDFGKIAHSPLGSLCCSYLKLVKRVDNYSNIKD